MERSAHTRGLLAAHAPADALEAEHLAAIEALLVLPGDVFARDHYDPGHVTASAFVVTPDRSALLLIHHAKLLRWLQPGGHIDPEDADVIAAALREVEEETGLADVHLVDPAQPLLDVDVHRIPARLEEPAHHHFDIRLLLAARTLVVEAATDAMDVRWVPLDEVNGVESDASVMRAVGKLRRGRLR